MYNGSDDALNNIFEVFVDEDTRVLIYSPSYSQVEVFITSKTKNIKHLIAYLRDSAVVVRDRSTFKNLENCARITITDKQTIELVISLLELYTKKYY